MTGSADMEQSHGQCRPQPPSPPAYAWTVWTGSVLALIFIAVLCISVTAFMYGLLSLPALVAAVVLVAWLSTAFGARLVMRVRPGLWLLIVGALALAVRMACVLGLPYTPRMDFQVFHDAGVMMSEFWTVGSETGGTYRCFFPPGQVFSLGLMYWLFGQHVLAGQMLNVVYGTLTVLAVWVLTRWLFGELAARTASLLAALVPSLIFGCMLLGAEVPQTFWLLAALCLWGAVEQGVTAAQPRMRRGLLVALAAGVCLGIGALIRPTYLLLAAPIGLHALFAWRRPAKALAVAAMLAAGTAAAVLPWTYRNYRVTGGFLLISSNGSGNLYSANNDQADGGYTHAAWAYLYRNATNDLALDRMGREMALEWIRNNPRRFLELSCTKFLRFWATDHDIAWWALDQARNPDGPPDESFEPIALVSEASAELAQASSNGFYLATILLACAGLLCSRRELLARPAWMVLPLIMAYFTVIHMIFESQAKYHFMLMPLLCVLASAVPARATHRDMGTFAPLTLGRGSARLDPPSRWM